MAAAYRALWIASYRDGRLTHITKSDNASEKATYTKSKIFIPREPWLIDLLKKHSLESSLTYGAANEPMLLQALVLVNVAGQLCHKGA